MKEIPLTRGKVAIVDDEDYECLSKIKWQCSHSGYAFRNVWTGKEYESLYMHLFIMPHPKGMETDHINRNRLDNRKTNLRICDPSQNQSNRSKQSNNKSGVIGVSWLKQRNKWQAKICIHRKQIHLGLFDDLDEANSVYKNKAIELFGEYCNMDGC